MLKQSRELIELRLQHLNQGLGLNDLRNEVAVFPQRLLPEIVIHSNSPKRRLDDLPNPREGFWEKL